MVQDFVSMDPPDFVEMGPPDFGEWSNPGAGPRVLGDRVLVASNIPDERPRGKPKRVR